MSTLCRQFRTPFCHAASKPLIPLGCDHVAKGRQDRWSLPGAAIAGFDNAHCRSFSTLHRVPRLSYTAPGFCLSDVLAGTSSYREYRHTTMRCGLPQAMTSQWFVMALTVSGRIGSQHNPPIEWRVDARIRGRCYDQEIATVQGDMRAVGVQPGAIDCLISAFCGM